MGEKDERLREQKKMIEKQNIEKNNVIS